MKHEIAMSLLSTATYGTLTTTELIQRTGHSPTTVVRYLGELEDRGWIERVRAERLGVGRPPVISRPTEEGLAVLRQTETAWFRKLAGNGAQVLWGPVRSFAYWKIPFMGGPDVFVSEPVDTRPFASVLERRPAFYEELVAEEDGHYPSLEALATWAAKSGDPRYVAAGAVLLRRAGVDSARLADLSQRMRARNRVGFLAALVGRDFGLTRAEHEERMLASNAPVERGTEALARKWRVTNPVSAATVKAMDHLYGRAE